jgi:NAD(P)-dependent dehydrogenase (short-subunit alcohol dehydrogenase family)
MSNWLQLANKTVIITGAASGIGAELVIALQSQGCNLLLSDIHANLADIDHAEPSWIGSTASDVQSKTRTQS